MIHLNKSNNNIKLPYRSPTFSNVFRFPPCCCRRQLQTTNQSVLIEL